MTKIEVTVFINAEQWLIKCVNDMGIDSVSAVHRLTEFKADGGAMYEDTEESTTKRIDLITHVKALRNLCQLVEDRKLFVGGITCAQELTDLCNWDVEVVDAFYQLAYHGEVIYG